MSLSSFAFIGIKDFVIRDRITKKVECSLKHMVNINLTDETAQEFLRGGYGNPKLLTLFGDRDCKLEGQTATMTTDLLKIQSNNQITKKTKPEQQVETISISGGKFSLKFAPSAGITPTIFKIDTATGKEVKPALKVGTPTSTETDYSISGKDITCHSSVQKIVAYYDADIEVETIEASDNTPKNYEGSGLLVAKEIETGKLYKAWIECPNMTVLPSFSLQSKNDSGSPNPVSVAVDLLVDTAKGYPYAISFAEDN